MVTEDSCYNCKPVTIFANKVMSEEHKDKAEDVTVIKEHDLRLVRETPQKNIPRTSEGIGLEATDARSLEQIYPLLK